MENGYQEIDLRQLMFIVLKRWWIILTMVIISVTTTGLITKLYLKPIYSAKTSLFVGKENGNVVGIDFNQLRANDQLVIDYREIAKSKLVAYEVIEKLALNINAEDFQKNIEITTIKQSRLFIIQYFSIDPQVAVQVVNELSNVLISKAKDIVEVENIQTIDRAEVSDKPIRPSLKVNITVAAVLGIIVAFFIIFLLEYVDHTIKTPQDVEKYLGYNVLGSIPKFEGERRGKYDK